MTTFEDLIPQLIPPAEQNQMTLRAVLLDLVRVHACCGCLGCRYALDNSIIHARLAGATRDEIKTAYLAGRKEGEVDG